MDCEPGEKEYVSVLGEENFDIKLRLYSTCCSISLSQVTSYFSQSSVQRKRHRWKVRMRVEDIRSNHETQHCVYRHWMNSQFLKGRDINLRTGDET